MSTKQDDKSQQRDFLNMNSHSPSDAKLLIRGIKGLIDSWLLVVLNVEYERLKKKQMQQEQQSQRSQKILLDIRQNKQKETYEGIRRKYYRTNKNSS